jgi:hypothetical protein
MTGFGAISGDLANASDELAGALTSAQAADGLYADGTTSDADVIAAYQQAASLAVNPQAGFTLGAPDYVASALLQIVSRNPTPDVRTLVGTATGKATNARTLQGLVASASSRDSAKQNTWGAIQDVSDAIQSSYKAAQLPLAGGGTPTLTQCPDGSVVPDGQPCPGAAPATTTSKAWVPYAVGAMAILLGAGLALYVEKRHHGHLLGGARENPAGGAVPVMFRKDREGVVFAIFPTIPEARGVLIYDRMGGHTSGPLAGNVASSRPASPREYEAIKRELEGYPYRYMLTVVQRAPRRHTHT